jgi:ornithine cyclodeaminase/alanine dehydrogenase-like protein (mu-crystallin family)
MTLILSNNDVDQLLTMRECVDVLEEAYVELAAGRGVSRTRSDCLTPTGRPDAHYSLKSMDGVIPKLGISAIRIDSDIITMPKVGNNVRREKVPAAPNDRYVGLVLLFSTENGEPLAIMPDGVIQRMRVGAANGLGAKFLARKDAQTVGILGSGWQAGAQLMAICAVRDIRSIRCFSPNRERREAFCKEMSAFLNVEVIPVDHPEAAIENADIAMCASNSMDHIFFEQWMRPGMHVSSIKLPEVEPKAMRRADRVAIHTRDTKPITVAASNLPESATTSEEKKTSASKADSVDIKKFPTLPELAAGMAKGRQNDEEVTLFLNNLGLGYQFAALGSVVCRKAKERGVGHELPTDWFTEDVHP